MGLRGAAGLVMGLERDSRGHLWGWKGQQGLVMGLKGAAGLVMGLERGSRGCLWG